ncbi:DUF1254 domain-containing protein [Stenotrophomonas sp. AB1(2024)]|uniref:DUF1254 domain-containing protein n=1 Tax=Stenotrophomonas sp. AB1(2024) TaxID=3132215 RepID=UPI00309C3188
MTKSSDAQSHNWLDTGVLDTSLGKFEFTGGYPSASASQRLHALRTLNRAVEVYLDQMPVVSWFHVWKGAAEWGDAKPNQLVIWQELMDSSTLLLTGNSETVYAIAGLDLKRDGPVVVELPGGLLGGVADLWQDEVAAIGPTGVDKGQGGKLLILPPGHAGEAPSGYLLTRATSFRVVLGVRGFLVDGKPDDAVARMRQLKIYPLAEAGSPPTMAYADVSNTDIDTIFADGYAFFEDLASIVSYEADHLSSAQWFNLAAIGIEKGQPFSPDAERKALLEDAAKLGAATARANTYDCTDPVRLVYPDRRWERLFVGGTATWDEKGFVNTDHRAGFAYAAIGMSPAMVRKIVGGGSQYLFTPRDANGEFLDGGRYYTLHYPANIPVRAFWSIVVYDAISRSMLKNGTKFPTISVYTAPEFNADGSIDFHFGPRPPQGKERNWVRTVEGRGWFPLLRFYGPLDEWFDQDWKPGDMVRVDGPAG